MSIAASISASRPSGVGPLYVFFDGTGTLSDATTLEFHEVYYVWSFGDPAGGATWTYGARTGTSKNSMTGPCGAHVFETPGTYTVTLTTYDSAGSVDQATVEITVTDPATVYSQRHFFSNDTTYAVGTPADNGTTVFRHDSTTDFDVAFSTYIATNRALYFEWGDTFTASTESLLQVDGPLTIGANPYGSGTKPVIDMTGDDVTIQLGQRDLPGIGDWRIVDLEINGNSGTGAQGPGVTADSDSNNNTGQVNQLLMLRLNIHHVGAGSIFDSSLIDFWNANGHPGHECHDEIALVDSVISNIVGGTSGHYCVFWVAERMAILGCDLDNDGGGSHTVRVSYTQKAAISNNRMAGAASDAQPARHTFKMHAYAQDQLGVGNPSGTGQYTELVVLSNNRFENTLTQWSVSIDPQDTIEDERVRNVILDGNHFVSSGSDHQIQLIFGATYITIRNNLWDTTGASWHESIQMEQRGGEPAPDHIWVYNNTFYSGDTDSDFFPVVIEDGTNVTVKNNIGWAPLDSVGTMISGAASGGATASNNSTNTQVRVDTNTDVTSGPFFAGSGGDGTGTFTTPAHFELIAGSYGIQGGAESVPVFDDYEQGIRDLSDMDMGFHAFTTGSLPGVVGTQPAYLLRPAMLS